MSFESHILIDSDADTIRARVAKLMRLRWRCSLDNFNSKNSDLYYENEGGWNNTVRLSYTPEGSKTRVDVQYDIRSVAEGDAVLKNLFNREYWELWVNDFERAIATDEKTSGYAEAVWKTPLWIEFVGIFGLSFLCWS